MKHLRIIKMCEYINQKEQVSFEDLQRVFNVSLNTIRKDVALLIADGKANKIYGGVCAKENHVNSITYNQLAVDNVIAKDYICSLVAKLINNGDTIFIDSGNTVRNIFKFLQNKRNITIVTHNVYLMYDGMEYDTVNMFALGGMLNRKTASFVGNAAINRLETLNINKAFICASGISNTGNVSNLIVAETSIKKQAMMRSATNYLLVDSSKFGEISLNIFANAKEFDYIITEKTPPQEYIDYFNYNNINCIYSFSDLKGDKWNYSWNY
ncbi:MAG: DeoR/GlpR family DNA-binding transcription regulator [Oscillospiraceae bacterium]